MKLDLDKILNATDFIQDVAQELGYDTLRKFTSIA